MKKSAPRPPPSCRRQTAILVSPPTTRTSTTASMRRRCRRHRTPSSPARKNSLRLGITSATRSQPRPSNYRRGLCRDPRRKDAATVRHGEEGAGSTFEVAVAIEATNKKVMRLCSPAATCVGLPAPKARGHCSCHYPWKRSAEAGLADGPLSDAVPTSCGPTGPPIPRVTPSRDRSSPAFKATYGSSCRTLAPDRTGGSPLNCTC